MYCIPIIIHVMAQIYYLMCTYALNVSYFLLRYRASHGVSRRYHLILHESVYVLCKKTYFACGMIVHRRLILVSRFVYCNDDAPDGHCCLQLDRDHGGWVQSDTNDYLRDSICYCRRKGRQTVLPRT